MTLVAPVPTRSNLFDLSSGHEPVTARINVVLYGNSGVGKTALATALPWGSKRWGNKAIYVAWDAGSESLLSVRPSDREHLIVVTPKPQTAAGDKLVMNPYKTAMEIANADWRSLAPEAKTIIWDGGTRLAEQILRAVANTGSTVSPAKKERGEETRLAFGEKGDSSFMALPITADYGMAQHAAMQWSEFLRQQPLNLIIICVSDYYKPEGGSLDGDTIGGPALVGVKIIPKFMKDFDNIFRLSIEGGGLEMVPGSMPPRFEKSPDRRTVWTQKQGIWDAKIRRPAGPNPLGRFDLTDDPTLFWHKFDEVTGGNNGKETLVR